MLFFEVLLKGNGSFSSADVVEQVNMFWSDVMMIIRATIIFS